jgi:hypothetical protein
MSYTPRPGSKTEAAVNFLRANGGQATAAQLAEGIDTEQKQFCGLFGAAITNGFLVEIEIGGKRGYRLGNATQETKAEALARELQVTSAVPARRSAAPWFNPPAIIPGEGATEAPAPAQAEKPEPKKKTVRQMARSLKIESFADAKPETFSPPPVAIVAQIPARPFKVGKFSDGTLRLEGVEADIFMEPFEDTEVTAITLSRDAAEKLVAYLASR